MTISTLRHARGFTLLELLIVVAVIGIIAAVAVPGLLRARMAGNESSAIGSLRAINSAQATYASSCAGNGYAQQLQDLATPPAPGQQPFIQADLATNGILKSGYTVTLVAEAGSAVVTVAAQACNAPAADTMSSYHATAVPLTLGLTGQRSFATDRGGAIYFENTGAAIANPVPAGQPAIQ